MSDLLDTFRGLGEIEAYKREASVAARKLSQAEAENEKLRELVRDMCEWAYVDSYCDLEDRFADRMRELGIEVEQ